MYDLFDLCMNDNYQFTVNYANMEHSGNFVTLRQRSMTCMAKNGFLRQSIASYGSQEAKGDIK